MHTHKTTKDLFAEADVLTGKPLEHLVMTTDHAGLTDLNIRVWSSVGRWEYLFPVVDDGDQVGLIYLNDSHSGAIFDTDNAPGNGHVEFAGSDLLVIANDIQSGLRAHWMYGATVHVPVSIYSYEPARACIAVSARSETYIREAEIYAFAARCNVKSVVIF